VRSQEPAVAGQCDVRPAEWAERLFDDNHDVVHNLIYRITNAGVADVEDLVVETFEAAFRSLVEFRGASSPRTWLCGIATRVCLRHLRRRARLLRGVSRLARARRGASTGAEPLVEAERRERDERVQAALRSLDPASRAIVVLHHIEDVPLAEIADLLQVPEGTIKSRLYRARERLRRRLGPYILEAEADAQ